MQAVPKVRLYSPGKPQMVVFIQEGFGLQHVHITGRCLTPLHQLSLHCSAEIKKKHLAWIRDQPWIFTGGFYNLTFLSLFIQDPERPTSAVAWVLLLLLLFLLYLHFAPVLPTCLWSTHVEGVSLVCRFCSGVFRTWQMNCSSTSAALTML